MNQRRIYTRIFSADVVSEPDPWKNRKEGLGDRLGWKCTCAWNAGTLSIGS